MITKNSFQVKRGFWNFANNGGAIGNIITDVIIPSQSIILGFWTDTIVNPASGGAATISWGMQTKTNPPGGNNTVLMLANNFAAFVAGQVLQGNNLMASPIKLINYNVVSLTIATAALTAGEIAFTIMYTENQI